VTTPVVIVYYDVLTIDVGPIPGTESRGSDAKLAPSAGGKGAPHGTGVPPVTPFDAARRPAPRSFDAGFRPPESPIMAGTPSHDFLRNLEQRRESIRSTCEEMLMECRAANREMNEGEHHRYRQAMADLRGLGEQIAEYRVDLERSAMPAHLARLSLNPQTTSRNAMNNHADSRDLVYRRYDHRQS